MVTLLFLSDTRNSHNSIKTENKTLSGLESCVQFTYDFFLNSKKEPWHNLTNFKHYFNPFCPMSKTTANINGTKPRLSHDINRIKDFSYLIGMDLSKVFEVISVYLYFI